MRRKASRSLPHPRIAGWRSRVGGERLVRVPLAWDEGFSVGVDMIDVEHRQILRRVRQLAGAIAVGSQQEIRGALKLLHAYLVERFADEEIWMLDGGYPGARDHARLHAAILDRVAFARKDATAAPGVLARAAADLAEVLDEHMRGEDLKAARFFTARENLRQLAEAGTKLAALTPLPGALAAGDAHGGPGERE